MPYKSQKQAAFMHIHHPDIAARWDKEYNTSPVAEDSPRKKALKKKASRIKNGLH